MSVFTNGQNLGGVVAINADTGALLWSQVTDGAVQGAPVALSNSVFVGSLHGDVVSYDVNYQGSAVSGRPSWINAAQSIDKFVVGEIGPAFCCKSSVLSVQCSLEHVHL